MRESVHGRYEIYEIFHTSNFDGSFPENLNESFHGRDFYEIFHVSFHESNGSFHGINFHKRIRENFRGGLNGRYERYERFHKSNFHGGFHEGLKERFH